MGSAFHSVVLTNLYDTSAWCHLVNGTFLVYKDGSGCHLRMQNGRWHSGEMEPLTGYASEPNYSFVDNFDQAKSGVWRRGCLELKGWIVW